ncbi:MAG: hypothetical protein NC390_03875 [Fusobacterium sp.]|nr:hypothetical protein [Fusobacterium sp.]
MNKKAQLFSAILGILILAIIILKVPAPMTQEQIEFDETILSAQREKARNNCAKALDILDTLKEEYPSTAIYLELEADGCFERLKQFDKMYDSCLNSKLTEYMPARAAMCSKKLANAGKFDEAASIWEKDIQDRPEEIFPYSQISRYEQVRIKTNMKIKEFFTNMFNPSDLTTELKKSSLEYINNKKTKRK